MAFKTGTATDYLDLMTQFRDFISGVDSPLSGLDWVVERDTSVLSPNGGEYEMIFRGRGDTSPEQAIYFGIKSYSNSTAGRYNWELKGFTGFAAGSPEGSVTFENQPGAMVDSAYVPLRNAAMSYWFYGNGRRVMMVAKTGTSYQFMYAGFLDQFATDVEYPYPMCICGSSYNVDQIFNDNDLDYSSIPHPAGDTSEQVPGGLAPLWVRYTDGQWYPIKHYSGTTNEAVRGYRGLWPLMPYDTSWTEPQNEPQDENNFQKELVASTAGGTPTTTLVQTPGSPDDISPMWPLTVVFKNPSGNFIGEMNNCFFLSGGGGIAAEDTITDSSVSPEEIYDVFTNVHRTDNWHYYAIKRE